MKINKLILGTFAAAALLMSSCSTPKDITYMQGFRNDSTEYVRTPGRLTVQPDDRLSIVVTSKDPAMADIFNLAVTQHRIGYSEYGENPGVASYTVTPAGEIDFPIIGLIKVEGLQRWQVAELVKNRLVSENLLKDPTVTVDFLNAKISVLGDVTKPGDYTIDRDDMTIMQAISKAGDLTITGQRDNVLVVREVNGKDVAYRINLTDPKSLFESPAYYVQQNDVIYVEPNNMKKRQATANGNTILTPAFWISVASLLTTITALIIK